MIGCPPAPISITAITSQTPGGLPAANIPHQVVPVFSPAAAWSLPVWLLFYISTVLLHDIHPRRPRAGEVPQSRRRRFIPHQGITATATVTAVNTAAGAPEEKIAHHAPQLLLLQLV